MSTSEPQEREIAEGEELVAYLDGELPPEETRQVEDRLNKDADYMLQLRELDQAWEALDALPRTVADDDFARTTIEMVAQKAQLDLTKRVEEVAQVERRNHLRWIAAAVFLGVAGFTIASMMLPNRDKDLLDNLPVIRQSNLLSEISDIDYLVAIANEVKLDDLIRDRDAVERELKAIQSASAPTLEAKEEWVKSLNPEQQQGLYAQQSRYFDDYKDEGREKLKNLYDKIEAHPDKEKLQQVLVAYGRWLVGKGENLKADLRDPTLEPSYRLSRINLEIRREKDLQTFTLSDAERSRMREEIRKIAEDHMDEALEFSRAQPPPKDEDPRVWADNRAKIVKFLEAGEVPAQLLIAVWALLNPDTREETRTRLANQFEGDTREYVESLEAERRLLILVRWISDTMSVARGEIGTDELRHFFATGLTPAQRQRLMEFSGSGEAFEAEVRFLLVERENGIRELGQLFGIDLSRGGQRGPRGGGPPPGGRGGRGGGQGGFGGAPPGPPPGGQFPTFPGVGPPPGGKRSD